MQKNINKKTFIPLEQLILKQSLETGINTTLNMLNNRIINVLTGSFDADAATLGFVEDFLQTPPSEKYLTLTGTKPNEPVTGDLTFDGHSTISQISSPVNDTDAVPLSSISSITNNFLSTSGTSKENPFTQDISFDNSHLVTGLANPKNPADAVNLQTLLSHLQGYFLITGDTLSGPLNINNQTLTNLANPSDPTDAANIQTITQLVSSTQEMFIPLSGTANNKPITGNLTLDNTKIIGLDTATDTSEAVNLDLLHKTLNNHLPLSGGTLHNSLNLNTHSIENLGTPTQDSDLINKDFLTKSLNSFVKLSGSTLSGSIDLSNNKIINLKDPQLPTDGVNLQTMKSHSDSHLNDSYIPYAGTLTSSPITGDIVFNGKTTVTGLKDPSQPKDIVNFQTLKNTADTHLPLSGGSLTGNIDLNNQTLSNISNPTADDDALNLQTLNNFVQNQQATYIPYTGTTALTPITGNLVLNNTLLTQIPSAKNAGDIVNSADLDSSFSTKFLLAGDSLSGTLTMNNNKITNLPTPTEDMEAVSLSTLNTQLENYLPLKGGFINYELNINNQIISGLSNPSADQDAVNLETLKTLTSTTTGNFIPLSGNTSSKPIRGDLVFDTLHLITGLDSPKDPYDAVNFLYLKTTSQKYLSLQGGSLTGILGMNNNNITNIPDLTDESDLSQLINQKTLNSKFSLYLPLSGGTLTGSLNCNNNTLSNIPTPTAPEDIVNRTYLTNYLNEQSSLLIPRTGNGIQKEITGNLTFQGALVTGLADPTQDTDAVNLQTLNSNFSSYMPLSGGALSGILTLNDQKISGLSTPTNNGDAVPLKYAQDYISSQESDKYLQLTGSSTASPITGDLAFSNTLVTGLADPTQDTDAVNLQTLNSKLSPYMPLSGGTLSGALNLNNQKIINLSDPINNDDAIPLKYAQDYISSQESAKYLQLTGSSTSSLITGKLSFQGALATGLANPTNSTDAVNLQTLTSKFSSYMPLSGGTLSGSINMGSSPITNVSDPTNSPDAVNLQTLTSKFSSYMPLSGGTLSGSINMGSSPITNVSDPTNNTDAVPRKYTLDKFTTETQNYLKLTGNTTTTPITGNLAFNNALITGLANPTNSTDAVNLQTLTSKFSSYIPLSGGTLSGSINMGSSPITNVSDPTNNTDAVPRKYTLDKFTTETQNYLKLTGNITTTPITGNLAFNNALITSLSNPINPSDAVNLQTLNSKFSSYMPLSGGSLSGPIFVNEILNIKTLSTSTSAVSYEQTQTFLSSKILPLSGNSSSIPLTHNFNFNNSSLITGLKDPIDTGDAVNLQTLNSRFSNYLPLSGGTMSGSINVNNKIINNLTANTSQNVTQALTLSDINKFCYNPLLGIGSAQINTNNFWHPNTPINISWSSGPQLHSPNYNNFFSIEDTHLYPGAALTIFVPGLYTFTLSILTNTFDTNTNAFIEIALQESPSTQRVLSTGSLSQLSSFSYSSTIYIDPSFSNPYISIINVGTLTITVYCVNFSINKIIG